MAFVTIEDLYGAAEIIVFENAYQKAANLLMVDNVVLVDGRLSIREDEDVKIIAREIKELGDNIEEINQDTTHNKILQIDITNLDEHEKTKLRGALKFFNGERNNTKVQVIDGEKVLDCGTILLNKEILEEFKDLMGQERVNFC